MTDQNMFFGGVGVNQTYTKKNLIARLTNPVVPKLGGVCEMTFYKIHLS